MSSDINEKLYGKGLVYDKSPAGRCILAKRFLMPPFSVWNTKEAFWQERKRAWLRLGIKSEVGRDDALTYNIPLLLKDGRTGRKVANQTSIFDPVLTEVAYRWWCPPAGVIVDPFAGGSVRGIVASVLGYKYWGVELRDEQVEANRGQVGPDTAGPYKPKWVQGDAAEMLAQSPPADFLFTCPPYGNLEKYSDDPKDLSSMEWGRFGEAYLGIIEKACARLRPDRFACIVVGNYRDRSKEGEGVMRDLVGGTVGCFQAAGLDLYNDIVLLNSVGSGAMRANGSFVRGGRKVVKLHQNVLVFVKGDPRRAAANVGILDD